MTQMYHDGYKVQVLGTVIHNNIELSVYTYDSGDYTEYGVCKSSALQKWEDTWQARQIKERDEEVGKLIDKHDELVDGIIKEACTGLATRIGLNSIFSKTGFDQISAVIVQELKKIAENTKIVKKIRR